MSRHPVAWFALGATVSWGLVSLLDSHSMPWTADGPTTGPYIGSAALYLGLGAFIFGMHGVNMQKGRPWPPIAPAIPFGLGLLHAGPALLGTAFAPRLATMPHESALVALATSFGWVYAEPVAAAVLTIRMAARPGGGAG